MTTTTPMPLNLTTTPVTVEWPETHYVYIEKAGNIPTNAPQVYVDDPRVTPEHQLRTEILFPVR